MIKAFFIDFYGTVVHEDGHVVKKISEILSKTGNGADVSEIDRYWGKDFRDKFQEAYGDNFETQRELERQSLQDTIEHFDSDADPDELADMLFEQWVKPPIYEDSKEFMEQSPLPVYIVSNIDKADIEEAIKYHGLNPAGVFTSEDAKSYKPCGKIFDMALEEAGLRPNEVIHIGDSIGSDVKGAGRKGIRALWINRNGRDVPNGVECISSLTDALSVL